MTQGQKLSILFARAISKAPADQGLANRVDGAGMAGLPGWTDWAMVPVSLGSGWRRDGERVGLLKERRYSPMKKISFKAQKTKRTVCEEESYVSSVERRV